MMTSRDGSRGGVWGCGHTPKSEKCPFWVCNYQYGGVHPLSRGGINELYLGYLVCFFNFENTEIEIISLKKDKIFHIWGCGKAFICMLICLEDNVCNYVCLLRQASWAKEIRKK